MTIQSERAAAREAAKRRRSRFIFAAVVVCLLLVLVVGLLLFRPGGLANKGVAGPTPTPAITPVPTVSHPPGTTLVPTPTPLPGTTIGVTINGVSHSQAGDSGSYSFVAPFGAATYSFVFSGVMPTVGQGIQAPIMICDSIEVFLPPPYTPAPSTRGTGATLAPGSYGPGPDISINAQNSQKPGTVITVPPDPDFASKPIQNAQWTISYNFC